MHVELGIQGIVYILTYLIDFTILHMYVYLWPNLTKASFHTHNGKTDFSPPLDFYINKLTIHMCIIANCSHGLLFLGLVSQVCLACSSARVVFKWPWCDWTGTHLAGNRHMTGQKAWPSNWLLFVISRAWMGLRWDHLAVSTSTHGKKPLPWFPTSPDLHPYMIICHSVSKMVGNSASCLL